MMHEGCGLDDATLLDYISGNATPEVRATVEGSPACRSAAEQLARELGPLLSAIYRVTCPEPDTLVAYQERRLDSTAQLVYRRHVAECPHCQAEYQLLVAMDRLPLEPAPGLIRRVVEAVFRPPEALPVPLRGEILHYQTPEISLVLTTRLGAGRPIHWSLRGEARTHDGQRAVGLVEDVVLRPLESLAGDEAHGAIAENGTFSFHDLAAGRYSLHVVTREEEVVIRQIVIGDLT